MIRCSIKYISSLLLILTVGFPTGDSLKVGDQAHPISLVGKQAPPISLFKLESNKYFRSKELIGEKHLVVSFFATWCVPCAKEIPKLTDMSKELGDDFQAGQENDLVEINEIG